MDKCVAEVVGETQLENRKRERNERGERGGESAREGGGKPRDKYRWHLSCTNRLEALRIERQAESFDRFFLPLALCAA